MIKKIVAIILFILVVCTIAGCTTSTTNQTPSATPSTTTHDAFLEKFLAAFKTSAQKNSGHIQAWELTWTNSTSAHLECTSLNKTTNRTVNAVETFIVFPTSQDATQYLNAMNKTNYSLASTEYTSGGAYQKATGHAPKIYKNYEWNEGNPLNISEYKFHRIEQADNIVVVTTAKALG